MGSGVSVWRRIAATVRGAGGRSHREALAQAEDDARRAETRLREALDVLPEGIVLLDPEGRYILWNKRYAEIYHGSADLFREGARLADTLRVGVMRGDYPRAVGREEEWLAERLAALDNPGETHEQQLADGRWIRIEERRTSDGGNIGLRVDITDLKQQSQDLEAALHRAEIASRARSEFLAKVSHELRTPLNGIVGMAGVLSQTPLTPEQTEALAAIRASSSRLSGLIADLLDFNALEAGQIDLETAPFAIADLVRDSAHAHEAAARGKELALTVEIAGAAEARVMGDARRVRQILDNLIDNAVKFTDRGHIDVALDAELTDAGPRYSLSVRDTGRGFAPQEAERLFDRFEQVDGSATDRHGGIGLGLAICLQLTERMGGTIRAEGSPGRGAAFTVALPLPTLEGAALEPIDALRVLVADDNATNRRVVELMLGAVGAQVVSVEDGAQAVAAAREAAFDVVLMDLRMPVMDGLTAIRAIRAEEAAGGRPRAPVVVLSANTSPQDLAESKDAGADGHVGKPIQVEALLAAIGQAISHP